MSPPGWSRLSSSSVARADLRVRLGCRLQGRQDVQVVREAIIFGATMIDTAEAYGPTPTKTSLVAHSPQRRDHMVLLSGLELPEMNKDAIPVR